MPSLSLSLSFGHEFPFYLQFISRAEKFFRLFSLIFSGKTDLMFYSRARADEEEEEGANIKVTASERARKRKSSREK